MTATENLQPHRASSNLAGAQACNIITSKQDFKLLLLLLLSLWNFTSSVDSLRALTTQVHSNTMRM